MKKIAVLMGGTSSERPVSLASGKAVANALRGRDLSVEEVVLDADTLEQLPHDVDVCFLALHGGYGEDGGVQRDLDERSIPYTGPGAAAAHLAMDKAATKKLLLEHEIPTPAFEVLPPGVESSTMALPVVVKPPSGGSSVGISKVSLETEWLPALTLARGADTDGVAMVESYIPGREWSVGVLEGEALPVIEIVTPNAWYGYDEKYTPGISQLRFVDSQDDQPLAATCRILALRVFEIAGCRGVSRVDFRITPEGQPYVLELNTTPGFTATSLLPKAAARVGIKFDDLCIRLLRGARYGA